MNARNATSIAPTTASSVLAVGESTAGTISSRRRGVPRSAAAPAAATPTQACAFGGKTTPPKPKDRAASTDSPSE